MILRKVQYVSGPVLSNPDHWTQTYYIYDDLGQLRYVLQPELSRVLAGSDADSPLPAQLSNYVFQYKYDVRGRVTRKFVPGADWVYSVYDSRDRLLMTQDGNQRLANQWSYLRYDIQNRPVITGIYTHTSTIDDMAMSTLIASTALYETYTGAAATHGYSANMYSSLVAANFEVLTVKYYDDYTFKTLIANAEFDYKSDRYTDQYKFDATGVSFPWLRGQATGAKTKVLGQSTYLWSVSYYDDKYRVVQATATNTKSGVNRITNVYDFVKLLKSKTEHLTSTATQMVTRRLIYDHMGRMLKTMYKLNDQPELLLSMNEYNELGELVTRKLHAAADPLIGQQDVTYSSGTIDVAQYNGERAIIAKTGVNLKPGFTVPAGKTFSARTETVWSSNNPAPANNAFGQVIDYRYNIRGWLTRINNSDLSPGQVGDPKDYFGMNLIYEQPDASLANTAQYNGNISAMKWSAGLGLGTVKERAYSYAYDPLNRLQSAAFKQNTAAWAAAPNSGFSESGYTYDYNGNIMGLTRNGYNASAMDVLTYDYGTGIARSNKLLKVADAGDITKGFIDGANLGNDYTYDVNGNMITDQNKALTAANAIQYNHLNLPKIVTKSTGDYISYIYDATGGKLRQEVYNSGNVLQKSTDYIGEFIYENNLLQFINTEEGRVVMTGTNPEYQYHMKDHLGNVRMTFTTRRETEANTGTLETVNAASEQSKFLRYDNAKRVYSTLLDHTNGAAIGYAERLNGSANEKYGLARSISVMPGDTVNMEVYAKYIDPTTSNWTAALATLMSQISSGTAGVVVDGAAYPSSTSSFPWAGALSTSGSSGAGPKAYLNWLVFDKNFVLLNGGYMRMTTAAKEAGSDVPHEKLSGQILVTEPGYVYAYLSNEETTPVEVYFDDFKVTQIKSPVIATDDYYPFGLTFNSYRRENSVPNPYQYNGKELQDELNLGWLDYGARMYMPDIGRWGVIDLLSERTPIISPYAYAYNNPLRFTDPTGMANEDEIDRKSYEKDCQYHVDITYSSDGESSSVGGGGSMSGLDFGGNGNSNQPPVKLKNATLAEILSAFQIAHDLQWQAAERGEEMDLSTLDLFDFDGAPIQSSETSAGRWFEKKFQTEGGEVFVYIQYPLGRRELAKIDGTTTYFPNENPKDFRTGGQKGFRMDIDAVKTGPLKYSYAFGMYSVNYAQGRLATIQFEKKNTFLKWRPIVFNHESKFQTPNPIKLPPKY